MPAGRRIAATVAAVSALVAAGPPAPASAHGAPTNPLSRAAACGPEGGTARTSAACRAARAAGFAAWDNLRVAGVEGRDRAVVPDGELCSGGLPAYRGLDLPRDDWPSTTLTPGATITSTYRGTIPHAGEFRLYVTRGGYDPGAPLTWDDLEPEPFFAVTDPPFTDGEYRMRVTLPTGRTGRHLIYTIWENAGPDTYYSCADVIFKAPPEASAPASAPAPATTPSTAAPAAATTATTTTAATPAPSATTEAPPAPGTLVASRSGGGTPRTVLLAAGALLALLTAAGTAALVVRARRTPGSRSGRG